MNDFEQGVKEELESVVRIFKRMDETRKREYEIMIKRTDDLMNLISLLSDRLNKVEGQ